MVSPQHAVLRLQSQMIRHPLQQQTQFFHAERLGDVIVGAILHRLHRRLHRPMAGHYDHQRVGAMLLDRLQRFQTGPVRRPQIQQHGIGVRAVEKPVGLLGGLRHLRVESERLGHLAAGFTESAVAVHDQKIQEVRALDLRGMTVPRTLILTVTAIDDGCGRCRRCR